MRLEGKVAVIVGAGQSPGEGIGNGRATALRFAQEGARILAVDRLIASAEETAAMANQAGECVPFAAVVRSRLASAASDHARIIIVRREGRDLDHARAERASITANCIY